MPVNHVPSHDGHRLLAPYAAQGGSSKGRLHKEPESAGRSAYQRDRDRIIHSTAFRRLEYKTQVFVYHEGDHFRTRLTHSLEVAQLARDMARELWLNEDLTEAIALAHDLGHTPFGHAGERAVQQLMQAHGGYDHNAQSIRILTKLERRYAAFDGLNLTWETLEGIAKHNGPVKNPPRALQEYNQLHDLALHTYPSLEAQVAAICDDIAYNNHDMEDGLRAGFFTLDEVATLPLFGGVLAEIRAQFPALEPQRLIHELRRRSIHAMVKDVVTHTIYSIATQQVESIEHVRQAGMMLVGFSEPLQQTNTAIRTFLKTRMYHHYKVSRMTSKAARVLNELFNLFITEPECLPTEWGQQVHHAVNTQAKAEIIADYLAGMTDRYAMQEYRRCFDPDYKLMEL